MFLVDVGFVARKMNVLVILAALASGGLCNLPPGQQLSSAQQLPTQQTVYIQESTAPPKTVSQYTSVSSPAAAAGHLAHSATAAGASLSNSYPTAFAGSARNFGSAKSIASFPSYSRSYQRLAAQPTLSKTYTSYVTTPSYSTTVSPTYSTVYSTPRSSSFSSGAVSTAATPVTSYPVSYSTPTVSTFSSSFPTYVTPTAPSSYPAYTTSVSSTSSPFFKAYSTPATVTTTYPAANGFKSTFSDYNVYSSASPQIFRDSSRPVVTQFSSPGLWTSQGTSRSFSSNGHAPVTIQKSTTFTPVKPTLTAYADKVTLHPLFGQYNTALKNLDSQYSTQQFSQSSPITNVIGTTVYTKPAYNSYSSISSVPIAYSTPASWAVYPTAQSVSLPAAKSYSYSVPAASHGSHWSGNSNLSSSSAYNVHPSAYTYTLHGAPLAREYHTLESPHAHTWNTANTWGSLPTAKQLYVS
ncbi:hypothetical protein RR46_14523 [Papilio xuthus]|uniref:Uncharacterized protein n=1 Tax=Papilio xuthus TaxID=66420 RepID=A0A194PEA0_PAPXU|nr:hypothetical protein RR46_14523 [Papilio xuthus]